jgi:hypothetical protein
VEIRQEQVKDLIAESVEGTTLNKKTAHLKEVNRQLQEENQMLKFKVEILLDMVRFYY